MSEQSAHEILQMPKKSNKEAQMRGDALPDYLLPAQPNREDLEASTPKAEKVSRWEVLKSKLWKREKEEKPGPEKSHPEEVLPADIAKLPPDQRVAAALAFFKVDPERGLSDQEAAERLLKYGPNEIPMEQPSKLLRFALFFWNPLSWVMEIAAILAVILQDWLDFGLILALLFFNACLGYYEETSSGNAIKALQRELLAESLVKRDRLQKRIKRTEIVPGDIVFISQGGVVPADCIILPTDEVLKVDQSSLTGETIPVNRRTGDDIYGGSILKNPGAVLTIGTGRDTYAGKAAALMTEEVGESHIYRILAYIGWYCIILISAMATAMIIVQWLRNRFPCNGVTDCPPLENALVVIVGGVPIAMPTVLSVTMATGAFKLAQKKAIVARLTAVEELAGMDVLCSDKTGTLTKNKLTLFQPLLYGPNTTEDFVLAMGGAGASPAADDAIDLTLINSMTPAQQQIAGRYSTLAFKPFDPVGKKTVATLKSDTGEMIWVEKGAPQVILDHSTNQEEIALRVNDDIDHFASRGYRTIGLSTSTNVRDFTMIGLIPLYDPPRDDTKETIEKIKGLGIKIKMITGDQVAIAKETARLIGLGDNIVNAKMKGEQSFDNEMVMASDGFAQVFPEHKYAIVKSLLDAGHDVGMTGDGVNDAPALNKASIGIAVEGATDAAKAAADIVLVSPGLSVIYDAIIGARKIFQRMKNYAMYSISSTTRIVLTFGVLAIAFDYYFPAVAIVLLAILNDLSMIAISRDRVQPSPTPDRWDLREIFGIALALGAYLAGSTITLFVITLFTSFWTQFGLAQLDETSIRGLLYYQVSLSGLATIFITRAPGFFLAGGRPGFWLVVAFIGSQTIGAVFCAIGLNAFPNDGIFDFRGSGWGYILVAIVWSIAWFILMDPIKLLVMWLTKRRLHLRQRMKPVEAWWRSIEQKFQTKQAHYLRRPSVRRSLGLSRPISVPPPISETQPPKPPLTAA